MPPTVRWLSRGEQVALVLFFLLFALLGLAVEKRSAFMQRRMGDVGVYFRAGWAARQGGRQLYNITDDNGWHYCYPPLFAVLMMPLADPPHGAEARGTLPYAVLVAIFYGLNLLVLALAVHLLAGALEKASPHADVRGQPGGCRRWWMLRLWPVLICLPPIGHTLMRGQVNLILLLCVCGLSAALMRGRRLQAGLWLAGAICLKIFPAYLLLVPLWRRDLRCLFGCTLGLLVGLLLIPLMALGWTQTLKSYEELTEVLIRPALNMGQDQSRAKELIEQTATDSQSFMVALHNSLHLDRNKRPNKASARVRRVHLLLVCGFTALTLATVWRRRRHLASTTPPWRETGLSVPLFVGTLALIMLLASPVCHTHYFVLSLVLVMTLLAQAWDQAHATRLTPGLFLLFVVQVVGNVLPLLPPFEVLKDIGLAGYTALVLWLSACLTLLRLPEAAPVQTPLPSPHLATAA